MAATLSAGLLLHRRTPPVEVLLGHMGGPYWASKDEAAWSIPKGVVEPGESPIDVARREFLEEVGIAPADQPWIELGTFRQSAAKTIVVWAAAGDLDPADAQSNTFEMEWPPKSGVIRSFPEVDRVAWFDLATARRKVVRGQVQVLDALESVLERAPSG